MKAFGSKKLLKLILQFAIGLVLLGLLWILFSFTRPKYNDDALFSYEIINQSNQNIEELIIGEYSENDINSPEDRVYLTKCGFLPCLINSIRSQMRHIYLPPIAFSALFILSGVNSLFSKINELISVVPVM